MAFRKLNKVSSTGGHDTLAEWETETVSPERLAEIEKEFDFWTAKNWFASDVTVVDPQKGTDGTFIRKFDPNAEILLFPPCVGG